jgi:predicted anti-sigma-YlaC factor YlaD
MGRMKSADCDQIKGLIALSIVDQLPEAERPALLAHLEGCEECREDERQLRPLVAGLEAADVDRVDDEAVPHDLSTAVLGDLSARSRKGRRTARIRYALAATAAAAVLAIALVLVSGSGHTTETAALVGTSGVKASAQLTAESWGTSVAIEESAQRAGQVMWVSMSTRSGSWWDTGTYRAVAGQTVRVTLACALNLHDIEYLVVRNSSGKVVLRADFS